MQFYFVVPRPYDNLKQLYDSCFNQKYKQKYILCPVNVNESVIYICMAMPYLKGHLKILVFLFLSLNQQFFLHNVLL